MHMDMIRSHSLTITAAACLDLGLLAIVDPLMNMHYQCVSQALETLSPLRRLQARVPHQARSQSARCAPCAAWWPAGEA